MSNLSDSLFIDDDDQWNLITFLDVDLPVFWHGSPSTETIFKQLRSGTPKEFGGISVPSLCPLPSAVAEDSWPGRRGDPDLLFFFFLSIAKRILSRFVTRIVRRTRTPV